MINNTLEVDAASVRVSVVTIVPDPLATFIALHYSDEIFALPQTGDFRHNQIRRNLDEIAALIRATFDRARL